MRSVIKSLKDSSLLQEQTFLTEQQVKKKVFFKFNQLNADVLYEYKTVGAKKGSIS